MIFTPLQLPGIVLVDIDKKEDDRGFFARTFCAKEFALQGLCSTFTQCNISYNKTAGTVRGFHYQTKPYEEIKIVTCNRGAIYDIVVDLRSTSPTYKQWLGVELTQNSYTSLYIPQGFAHGFQILTNDTEVYYQMSQDYHPECSAGIRWDDPLFTIKFPLKISSISNKDKSYVDFVDFNEQ